MPPVLYLDSAAANAFGRAKLESAPCSVEDLGVGILLVVEEDLSRSTTPEAYARRRGVAVHLGVEWGGVIEP